MIKSYWVRLLVFAVVGGVLALAISLLIPKKYEGFVQILIDQKPISPVVPTSSAAESVTDLLDFARSRGITTQVQQLTSFTVLTEAARATWDELGRSGDPAGEFTYFELVDNISVEAEVGSDLVVLRVRMSSPDFAARMANNIYLAFVDFNQTTTRALAGQAVTSLESQMQGVKTKLAALDSRTMELRRRLNAPNIDSQIVADISNISKIKDMRDTASVDLATAEAQLKTLRATIATVPPEIVSSETENFNSTILAFDQTLAGMRSELAGLEERYLPTNELVIATKQRIQKMEEERAKQLSRIQSGTTTTPNPLHQSLKQRIGEAQATVDGLRKRIDQAEIELSQSETRLETYPESQAQLLDLARQQATLERTYANYADKLQSLELSGRGRSAPTRSAGNAPNPIPVSPKPVINMLIGVVIGFVLGVMSMLRTESARQPVRSIMQLNLLSSDSVFRALPNMSAPFRGLERTPPEAFDALVANALRSEKRPYRIGFVGVVRDSGASTAALNYAVSASRRGLNAILASLDPRSPNARRLGNVPGDGQINERLRLVEMSGADVVTGAGGHTSISDAVSAIERDVTVFDFEPACDAADYAFAASELDEIVLLVRANRVNSVDFLAVQQAVRDSGCPVITVVLSRGTEGDAVADAPDPTDLRALPS